LAKINALSWRQSAHSVVTGKVCYRWTPTLTYIFAAWCRSKYWWNVDIIIAAPASCEVRTKKLWLQYSGTVRKFCWQNSWHQGPQKRQMFIVKSWISIGGPSKTNGAGCSLNASFSCTTTRGPNRGSHKCFNQTLQLGDFRPPSLQSGPDAKRLPSLHQAEGLDGYPALPHQWRANGWS